jgi:hypothetical protein
MKPHEKAKAWRIKHGLTQAQLSDMSGYAISAIFSFERGDRGPGVAHSEWSWRRYRMVCAGIDRQLRSGREFEW